MSFSFHFFDEFYSIIKKLFMQSMYFLSALLLSGFFILLGYLIYEILNRNKDGNNKQKVNKIRKVKSAKEKTKPNSEKHNKTSIVKKDSKTGRFVSTKKLNGIVLPLLLISGSVFWLLSSNKASALITNGANKTSFSIGAESAPPITYVNVTFVVNYGTNWGERIAIAGLHGDWSYDGLVSMSYHDGADWYTTEPLYLPTNEEITFKFVVADDYGHITKWEKDGEGNERHFTPTQTETVRLYWGNY